MPASPASSLCSSVRPGYQEVPAPAAEGSRRFYDPETGEFHSERLAPTPVENGTRRSRAARRVRDYLEPDYLTGPAEHFPAVARSDVADWRLPPRGLPRTDYLADEAEPVPVQLITRMAPDAPTLRFGQAGRRDLDRFAGESRDGLETGGFIFGHRDTAEGPRVHVSEVTRSVEARAATAVRFDVAANVDHKLALRRNGDNHLCEIGEWHTHPEGNSGMPSDGDLQGFVSKLDHAAGRKGLTRDFALILTPGRSNWLLPEIHGWMVTRGRSGMGVCKPVRVN